MVSKRKSKSNNKVRKVDLSNVESKANLPIGSYPMKLIDAVFSESGSGNDQIEATFEVQSGKFKGKKPKAWIPFTEQTYWRVRNFLEALGAEIPDSAFDLDLDALVDEAELVTGVVEVQDEKYGPKLVDFLPAGSDDSDDEEEEEDEKPAKKKAKSSKDEDDEEEDEGVTESDVNDMDEDELEELVDDQDLDVDLDEHKSLSKKRKAVIAAMKAAGDDEDEEDEEEDEKPAKKSKSKSKDEDEDEDEDEKPSKKSKSKNDDLYSEDDIQEMGTKELRDIVKKHKLDVELEGSSRQKRKAVIEALRDEELLA